MKIEVSTYAEHVKLFCKQMPLASHNTHMTLGIIEEIEELMLAVHNNDKVNIVEELGDLFWYLSQYCLANGISFNEQVIASLTRLSNNELAAGASSAPFFQLLVITKKEFAYDKVYSSEERIVALAYVFDFCSYWFTSLELDIENILQTNYDKLSTRYISKAFSNDAAINRDTDTEREVLETSTSA